MNNESKIKDQNPFRVPENYFDEVKSKVLSGPSGNGGEEKKSYVVRLLKPALTLAAAMLALAIISYSGLKLLFPENEQVNEVSYTEFIHQFDEAELIDIIVQEEYNSQEFNIDSDEIIDYLLEQDIEYTLIIELLNQEI